MTIIPASALDRRDMSYLGANVRAAVRRDRIELAAQQRSLACCGLPAEQITWLDSPEVTVKRVPATSKTTRSPR